ncbi:hypothetical protein LJC27_03675 [Christensenellaceae bacterium OttesenSCG-928-M15]|nr:hypothetical protein [Christensenellaceae bacterium OttesenSCG-928-M15]
MNEHTPIHPLNAMIETGERDLPLYITDVRNTFLSMEGVDFIMELTRFDGGKTRISLRLPVLFATDEKQTQFLKEYVFAEIYNILSSLGGVALHIYTQADVGVIRGILEALPAAFCLGASRKDRKQYGRSVNVIERMLDSEGILEPFQFHIHPLAELPAAPREKARGHDVASKFQKAFEGINGKILLGIDVGGTDIKLAVSLHGTLCYLKEYDWFPAIFTRSYQLIDPIVLLTRLLRARISCGFCDVPAQVTGALDNAINAHVSDEEMAAAVISAEQALNGAFTDFDGIGLCFPDVVIKNKIVGGEVFKTRGIRDNPNIEYEVEFKKLMHLDALLKPYCKNGTFVNMTNDGPMAAFTASMELIAKGEGEALKEGRFAHTLGTELGTGWIDEAGEIPEIPLEVYNFIIDLGSYGARAYHPDDLRSINNFNTGLPGTLQKFMAQNGVYRLAIKRSLSGDGSLYRELVKKGFIEERDGGIFVALSPKDMRKPLLEYLMQKCEAGDRDLEEVFLEIGRSTGITFNETEHILSPRTKERILYGRLVKTPHCFELIKQGAESAAKGYTVCVADEHNAFSPLMLQLKAHPVYTVAQFAQSVGAIYFSNIPGQ